MKHLNKRPIVLASKSPRRKFLMENAGFQFTVRSMDVNEDFPADMPPHEVAEFLAVKKANGSKSLIQEETLLVTADTTVIFEGKIFNKPLDEDDARTTLRKMAGKMHLVVTGVCLMSSEKMVSFSDTTEVWIDDMTDEEINYYIETCQPMDKAGAYGIQEWIGWTKIGRLNGSYTNVMGLPLSKVYQAILDF